MTTNLTKGTMKLLDVARRIEKQLSNPMGDGGIDLDLLAALRVVIAEETESPAPIKSQERSPKGPNL